MANLLTWNMIVLVILFGTYLGLAYSLPDTGHSLVLKLTKVSAHNAVFRWSARDVPSSSVCTYSYGTINGTQNIRTDYIPQNYTLELGQLNATTMYEVLLNCKEGFNVTDVSYHFKKYRFVTAKKGEVIEPHATDSSSAELSTSPPDVTTELPSIQKERITDHLNPVDVAVGVVFGAIGLAIVLAILYYVVKKVRRQQRIRRFLQYRQQENDPFPGLEQQDDDGFRI